MEWQEYPRDEDGVEHTVVGSLRVLRGLESAELGNVRDLIVYLPHSYGSDERRYPVIYMHDGQNLFDRATAFGDEWHVDETMEAVSDRGPEAIVVGIPNHGVERCDEYSPFVDPEKGGGCGDQYVDFIVHTIKPLVDAEFRTLPEREHTGMVGSSMGGLITLYAFFREPEIFGFAGVMSPALWFAHGAIFGFVEQAPFVPGRIYLDVGTEEGEVALSDVRRMCELLRGRGYAEPESGAAGVLRYVEDEGAAHTESAWARRFPEALPFLLP